MSYAVSEIINPNRVPREPFGLKSESSLNRITFNLSSANPGEKISVNIPKLSDNVVIVPGSVYLLFDLIVGSHVNNTLVNNVGRNLVEQLKVSFGGEKLQETHRYDLFQTYHDLFLDDREDRLENFERTQAIKSHLTPRRSFSPLFTTPSTEFLSTIPY